MRWYWWALLALALSGGGVVVYNQTRGLRNNNPGNIRRTNEKWYGLSPVQNDTAFFTFEKPEYGIRALAKLLLNYERMYQLDTVRKVITRWAPGHENPTDSYVAFVANAAGVKPDDRISVRAHLPEMVRAIIRFENGLQPYPDDLINLGISMAT